MWVGSEASIWTSVYITNISTNVVGEQEIKRAVIRG